jgi:hypothetical protein
MHVDGWYNVNNHGLWLDMGQDDKDYMKNVSYPHTIHHTWCSCGQGFFQILQVGPLVKILSIN